MTRQEIIPLGKGHGTLSVRLYIVSNSGKKRMVGERRMDITIPSQRVNWFHHQNSEACTQEFMTELRLALEKAHKLFQEFLAEVGPKVHE